jgi:DNA-binding response OmpR family regulator
MKHILIVEDDPAIRKGLKASLEDEHFQVSEATDGEQGYRIAREEGIDLILLDWMLPGRNGDEICRDLRGEGIATPIIMLTSKTEEMDKVLGLEVGADDYVTKPFSTRELLARMRAVLRRQTGTTVSTDTFQFGDVYVDFPRHEVTKAGVPVRLSAKEMAVLRYLVEREGLVITRNMLLDDIWGYEAFPTTRTVDNYILALRKALEDDPSRPKHLLTIHGAGYKFIKGD